DGVAAAAAAKLTPQGYTVETGNADGFDYTQTIVVYHSSNQANEAKEIATALGIGKAQVNDGSFAFTGDFLVVVGSDFL
ncbi:MAG: LytR C-terminal domain-containing protein, partial [Raoultibacter sp.]